MSGLYFWLDPQLAAEIRLDIAVAELKKLRTYLSEHAPLTLAAFDRGQHAAEEQTPNVKPSAMGNHICTR